jgi:protein-S-isoprenylcysteine O-methyltransferase Ste14
MNNKQLWVVFRGIILAAFFILVWIWLAKYVKSLDAAIGLTPPDRLRPVGWILALAGGALGLVCVWLFVTVGRGTPAPFDPPKVFVATGPYRYVRNPMYLSAVLVLIGAGLIIRSASILILAVLFWSLAHLMVLYYEEPGLVKRFGDSYIEYTRQVHRWLPRALHN